MGYIDLHNHILPGLDDGPATMAEALELALALVGAGFSEVVATPHCFEGEPSPDLIEERLRELRQELLSRNIPLKLSPGAEHAFEPLLPRRLEQGRILTLNRSRFLLVELPVSQPLPPYTDELIFELKLRGCYPLLAHPERVAALQHDPGRLNRLVRAGALVQLTLGSISGLMGPAAARAASAFLSAGLVHFLATDAHNPLRLRRLKRSLTIVDRICPPGSARLMLKERPAAVLQDRVPVIPAPRAPAAAGGPVRFWFRKRFSSPGKRETPL